MINTKTKINRRELSKYTGRTLPVDLNTGDITQAFTAPERNEK